VAWGFRAGKEKSGRVATSKPGRKGNVAAKIAEERKGSGTRGAREDRVGGHHPAAPGNPHEAEKAARSRKDEALQAVDIFNRQEKCAGSNKANQGKKRVKVGKKWRPWLPCHWG